MLLFSNFCHEMVSILLLNLPPSAVLWTLGPLNVAAVTHISLFLNTESGIVDLRKSRLHVEILSSYWHCGISYVHADARELLCPGFWEEK